MKNFANTLIFLFALCFIVIHLYHYENKTIELERRMESVEIQSSETFQNVQKLNCQAMYGDECDEDFINVPPYENVEEIIVGIIKEHEKFSEKGYKDGCIKRKAGVCIKYRKSIGYGTREKTPGEIISEEEATERLKEHLRTNVFPKIPENVTDKGTFIALADLGYNAGYRAMKDCINFDGTLNVENYQKWTRFDGKRNYGLEKRRKNVLIYVLSLNQ